MIRSFIAFITLTCFAFSAQAFTLDTKAKEAFILDDSTGTVLLSKEADAPMHPSSMSKLMTIYMVFKRLKEGSLQPTDMFLVSEKAWRMQGSKMFVELNNQISVEDLLNGIIIQSGNDACVVIAEGLAGSEEAFAAQMNEEAKKIGLTHSHFMNATGWTDENHLTTAHDLAILSQRLIHDFPDYYSYFSREEFTYHKIHQHNRNPLLGRNLGVDGLKTGHTETAGYGIIVSGVSPQGRRIIMVINGLASEKERAEESERLLGHAYRDFENKTLFKKGATIANADVWMGKEDQVPLTAENDIIVTLPKSDAQPVQATLVYDKPVPAPIEAGQQVATLSLKTNGGTMSIPLVAAQPVGKLNAFQRIFPTLFYFLTGH